MNRRISTALLLIAGIAAPIAAAADSVQPMGISCSSIPDVVKSYLEAHIRYRQLSKEIERRTARSYLKRFDPSRSLLLTDEVERLEGLFKGVFASVGRGDCTPLMKVQAEVAGKHAWAEGFVRRLVTAPDYALDKTASLVIDPDKRGNPKSAAERDALLTNLVHFQISNYLSAETPLDEAKERLVHRYELRTRRARDLDPDDLYSAFLDSFAASLDPHSNYLSARVLEDFRIGMSLSLEGIGVALTERDGYSVVERIIPGGAADQVGSLKPKDKLIAVAEGADDPVDIIDMPLRDAVALIRGPKGTEVRLTVLREAEQTERFTTSIVRAKIDLEEQAAKLSFEERESGGRKLKLAVLKLPSFYGDADPSKRQSTEDMARLLREVQEAEVDGLLLDLSRNSGGLLEHAVTISGFFIRRGEVVGVRNAQGQRQILADRDDSLLYSGPMVVHTSRLSASAAEILAGALKDYRRAVIAGDDHTFGKGTVQAVSTLRPGQGALKVTTALFFRPGGQSTQNAGVEADVIIPSVLATDDVGEKSQDYSLPSQRIRSFAGSGVNAVEVSERWQPVTPEVIETLSKRSQIRIDASPEFAEVHKQLEEAENHTGVVALAEILEEREQSRAGDESEEEDGNADEDETPPQLDEAILVLADLITLTGGTRYVLPFKGFDGTSDPHLTE